MSGTPTGARGVALWTVPALFFLAAAVAGLAGWIGGGLIGVGLGFVAVIAITVLTRRQRTAGVVALNADESERVRQDLEQNGETAAVRALRQHHPELSLGDAVKLVRNL